MAEFPCAEFNEGDEFSGVCQNCGHPQDAHEYSEIEGNGIQVTTDGRISRLIGISQTFDKLPAGLYSLRSSPVGLYLRHETPFEIPDKVYGDCSKFANRVLKTYSLLNRGMGVLLSGGKGTGKTLTAKMLATLAMRKGVPVITIDSAFVGGSFVQFLDELPNRCMFLIDEWEKIYAKDTVRKFFLGVLDGMCRSRHLWVMTTNTEKVGDFFISRPGRIRYHKKYEGLPEGYIRGIVSDHIKNEKLREAVITVAQGIYNISPDILMAMIEEAVLHNESPEEFMSFFNVKPEAPAYDCEVTFKITTVDVPQEVVDSWNSLPKEEMQKLATERQQCRGFLRDILEMGETLEENMQHLRSDFPDMVQFVRECVHTAEKSWCEPFHYEPNGKMSVRISHLFYGEDDPLTTGTRPPRAQINFRIASDQVKEVKREGTQITVIAKNGDKVVARPAKRFESNATWGSKSDPHNTLD